MSEKTPKAYIMRDALGQAVMGVAGPQQEAAEGPNGWKTTLLAWVLRNGPFAFFSVLLSVALLQVASAYVDATDWARESAKEDRALSRAMARSNLLMAQAVDELVDVTKKGNSTSTDILLELRDFTGGVTRDHPEQLRILREIWERGMQ